MRDTGLATSLAGKVAIVTGGSQGVGEAVARRFAANGAAGIVIGGRDEARLAAVVAALEAAGSPALAISGDLAVAETAQRLLEATLARFGRIDVLVNAAGMTDRGNFLDGTPEFFDRMMAINTRTPFQLMQGAILDMRKRRAGGAIVNILSMNIHGGHPSLAIYSASKAATSILTKAAAHAHRFDRIRVNGINLGWTDTPAERKMQSETLGLGDEWLAKANAGQPFGRLLSVDDCARLTLFLASEASFPMTGALIDQEQWPIGAWG